MSASKSLVQRTRVCEKNFRRWTSHDHRLRTGSFRRRFFPSEPFFETSEQCVRLVTRLKEDFSLSSWELLTFRLAEDFLVSCRMRFAFWSGTGFSLSFSFLCFVFGLGADFSSSFSLDFVFALREDSADYSFTSFIRFFLSFASSLRCDFLSVLLGAFPVIVTPPSK